TDGLPRDDKIADARRRVNWRNLDSRAGPPALRKLDPLLTADFSGIAKGFASDDLSALLAALGATNHFVQLGGEVKARGHAADSRVWRAGIEQPLDGARAVECVVALAGRALSTSGDYRQFFIADGRRHSHLIDPRTGRPVAGALASVSVVHESGATADALATGLFVLGAEEGFRVATSNGLACLFLIRDGGGTIRKMTPEFERLLAR
ncbi:MAG: FAD:protein FMN transferase, partial [Verrucomicrobia bacterium]|nr:FAD:protein FMN transferase [Verrucomicrobiota bacterium]